MGTTQKSFWDQWLPRRRPAEPRRGRGMDGQVLELLLSLGATTLAMWIAVRMLKQAQSPITSSQRATKKRLCQMLGISNSELQLDEHEFAHLPKVMLPQQIQVTLQDVAGSDSILEQLRRDITFSCNVRPSSSNSMLAGSKGLLLYGPPGTGKTMIASAFAKEIQAVLINVRGSTLFSKWVGESERLTSALFSLAAKFSAAGFVTILFVDEVDALLGDKSMNSEHEVSRNMRTEFMQLWDGLLRARRVLVVAATNQPDRLPDSIWRRFSAHFEVPLPAVPARAAILRKSLVKLRAELNTVTRGCSGTLVPSFWFDETYRSTLDLKSTHLPSPAEISSITHIKQDLIKSFLATDMHPLQRIAQLTARYSGSDLVEVCKHAARHCVLEHLAHRAPSSPCDGGTVPRGDALGAAASSSHSSAVPPRPRFHDYSASSIRESWQRLEEWSAELAAGALGRTASQRSSSAALNGDSRSSSVDREEFHDVNPPVPPEAMLSEAVLLKCVTEVKAAANVTRRSYGRSSQGGGAGISGTGGLDEGDNEEMSAEAFRQFLMALAKHTPGTSK